MYMLCCYISILNNFDGCNGERSVPVPFGTISAASLKGFATAAWLGWSIVSIRFYIVPISFIGFRYVYITFMACIGLHRFI